MAEVTYSTKGQGNLATTLGAIGTGLGLLNNGGLNGLNLFGGGKDYATKSDLENAIIIAQKDNEITLLKSESNTEGKIIDTFKELSAKIAGVQEAQNVVNAQQAVYNSTMNATVQVLQGQTQQLLSLTALRIPNTSVCPGWGPVTVSPTWTGTSTTTT